MVFTPPHLSFVENFHVNVLLYRYAVKFCSKLLPTVAQSNSNKVPTGSVVIKVPRAINPKVSCINSVFWFTFLRCSVHIKQATQCHVLVLTTTNHLFIKGMFGTQEYKKKGGERNAGMENTGKM